MRTQSSWGEVCLRHTWGPGVEVYSPHKWSCCLWPVSMPSAQLLPCQREPLSFSLHHPSWWTWYLLAALCLVRPEGMQLAVKGCVWARSNLYLGLAWPGLPCAPQPMPIGHATVLWVLSVCKEHSCRSARSSDDSLRFYTCLTRRRGQASIWECMKGYKELY